MNFKVSNDLFTVFFWEELSWYVHYFRTMEQQLETAEAEARSSFARALERMGIDSEEETLYDHDHADKFFFAYPKNLRFSFTVLFGAFIEHWLSAVCDAISKRNGYSLKHDDLSGRSLERAKKFMEKVANINIPHSFWQPVHLSLQVRHCIVHGYGDVTKSSDKKNLEAAQGKCGYNIVGNEISMEREFPVNSCGY